VTTPSRAPRPSFRSWRPPGPTGCAPFAERTPGPRLLADDPFVLVFDANGVTLRVAKVQAFAPARGAYRRNSIGRSA